MKKQQTTRYYILIITIFLIVFAHCSSQKKPADSLLYVVKKTNFESAVTVSGSLESKNVYAIMCPPNIEADLTITWLVDEGSTVKAGDSVCQLRCSDVQKAYSDAKLLLETTESNLEKIKADQASQLYILQSQLKSTQASLDVAFLDTVNLKYYTAPKRKIAELNIEKSKISIRKIENKIKSIVDINNKELQKQQIIINQQKTIVAQQLDIMKKLTITTEKDGVVEYYSRYNNKTKVGDVIWNGRRILNVNDNSAMSVKLSVSENQYKSIEPNQLIDITLDAYPEVKSKGKILQKLPAKPNSNNNKSKLKEFEIVASIDSLPAGFQSGLSVTCKVHINKIKDVFTIPIMAVFEEDSSKVVYISDKKTVKTQKIETGLYSDKEIIVTKGLKVNDRILLIKPTD